MEIHAITVLVHVNVLQDIDHPRHTRTDRQTDSWFKREKERENLACNKKTHRQAGTRCRRRRRLWPDILTYFSASHHTLLLIGPSFLFSSLLEKKKTLSLSLCLGLINNIRPQVHTHTQTVRTNETSECLFSLHHFLQRVSRDVTSCLSVLWQH